MLFLRTDTSKNLHANKVRDLNQAKSLHVVFSQYNDDHQLLIWHRFFRPLSLKVVKKILRCELKVLLKSIWKLNSSVLCSFGFKVALNFYFVAFSSYFDYIYFNFGFIKMSASKFVSDLSSSKTFLNRIW